MEERGTQETDARGNQPEVGLGVGRVPEKVLGLQLEVCQLLVQRLGCSSTQP